MDLENIAKQEIKFRGEYRSFIQEKLYMIYFEPLNISYRDTGLDTLTSTTSYLNFHWTLVDHNQAVKFVQLSRLNLEELKLFIPKMTMNYHNIEKVREYYKQIIDYYEKTGFLEVFDDLKDF